YESWRLKGQVVYDPLIWAWDVLTFCPEHCEPFHSKCPHCSRALPSLDRRSKPGHCSKCGEWLGLSQSGSAIEGKLGLEELKWQTWITNAIGELLAPGITFASSLTRETLQAAISKWIERTASGNASRFSSIIGKPKTTVWGWQKGTRITLPDLL